MLRNPNSAGVIKHPGVCNDCNIEVWFRENELHLYLTHRLCTHRMSSDNRNECLSTSASVLAAQSVVSAKGKGSIRKKLRSDAGFTERITVALSAA